jgi:hypothetical protein
VAGLPRALFAHIGRCGADHTDFPNYWQYR